MDDVVPHLAWSTSFLAILLIWWGKIVGSSVVFFLSEIRRKTLDLLLGFAGGVMLAVCYWSLLAPALEISSQLWSPAWFPPLSGFLVGAACIGCIDRILPHLHPDLDDRFPQREAEGVKTNWRRSILLILAMTLHNIPEGLAVGIALGAAMTGLEGASAVGAFALAFGVTIQNVPEAMAVVIPLRREGMRRSSCFGYGVATGMVQPLFALLGMIISVWMTNLLPFGLAFAAGAMFYVVVEELIPASREGGHSDIATVGVVLGFALIMILDNVL